MNVLLMSSLKLGGTASKRSSSQSDEGVFCRFHLILPHSSADQAEPRKNVGYAFEVVFA